MKWAGADCDRDHKTDVCGLRIGSRSLASKEYLYPNTKMYLAIGRSIAR